MLFGDWPFVDWVCVHVDWVCSLANEPRTGKYSSRCMLWLEMLFGEMACIYYAYVHEATFPSRIVLTV